MDGEKEMKDGMEGLEKEEQNPGEDAGKPEAVTEDGGGESPVKPPASVSCVSGDGENVNVPSKDEEQEPVGVNGHGDANAGETEGGGRVDGDGTNVNPENQQEDEATSDGSPEMRAEENETENEEISEKDDPKPGFSAGNGIERNSARGTTLWETQYEDGEESGTEEEQQAFRREVENFYKERNFEFKGPKFYKEDVNLLKLYRAVIKLGGYEQVTSCKLWRQVGAPFRPPKTCTTVSWTFRNFYEKSLIEYEKHRMRSGKLPFSEDSYAEPKVDNQVGVIQSSGTGRAMRDAAARAMHVWNSPRVVDDEDGKPSFSSKSDKHQKSIGLPKRKKPSPSNFEPAAQGPRMKSTKPQTNAAIIDVGPPADWVKINVFKINDCYEVYALVPGLLREEVHVQSDPAGRLIISGQPQQLDNPWGVTPFKKVVSLPSRIDPHQTSAVVTLNGQLFVRVPFEQTDS
ncbi:AT-rich interactive domain-containing protein 5-like [Punica granatum]|uniref:Uncharacterized protein n=2 Tax=Punica granatum TaxID=22663 RepID=A0A218X7N2_PUNGR|nr:AT-rich interactive domain-containing protein 5-like [Punica granatum]OWM80521.1 hypothetical protein CDL15_Pgr019801 [Punica granatum]PKI52558.1 hypothetical protein CRG98_027130 [Punica granatum]